MGRASGTIPPIIRYLPALPLLACSALADTFDARVVCVTDGNVIAVLDANEQQHKIRFNGIDAPEKRQPFGTRSTQILARYVARKAVRLAYPKVDRYGRQVCEVWVQPAGYPRYGKRLDVGIFQITDGMACWFRRYVDTQAPKDRERCESAEDEARLRKRGHGRMIIQCCRGSGYEDDGGVFRWVASYTSKG